MSKIKVKVGSIEIECEGSEEFLKNELLTILKAAADLQVASPNASLSQDEIKEPVKKISKGSTGIFAGKMNVKKGGDLVLAAAAKLSFVDNKSSFTRTEILNEMRDAKSYYKKTYNSNLTEILKVLVRNQRLNEITSNEFSLSESESTSLAGILK